MWALSFLNSTSVLPSTGERLEMYHKEICEIGLGDAAPILNKSLLQMANLFSIYSRTLINNTVLLIISQFIEMIQDHFK